MTLPPPSAYPRSRSWPINVLLMCGLPGGYPDDLIDVDLEALEEPGGDGVIRVTNADYLARPLRLTPTEATAIIVALRALRGSAVDDLPGLLGRALGATHPAGPTWSASRRSCVSPAPSTGRCA
jgi:proteasome accessory factor C